MNRHRLTLDLPDRAGLLAEVAAWIRDHLGDVSAAQHHVEGGRLYLRFCFGSPRDAGALKGDLAKLAADFRAHARLADPERPARVVVLVSKEGHCLYDLLARQADRDFPFVIPCVISNHETHRRVVEAHGIPFHHVPVSPETKPAAMERVRALFAESKGDWMVLARYMQVLDAPTCEALAGRILNIHHAFLPSFPGAKPYHQAHAKGVKLVGATCHFVTADLDAGPIVEQDVIRVDHADSPEAMARRGRDIEVTVLARGLRSAVEDRVFLAGQRTVVFR
ncbi:MAG: formyltetrahydrofolate deformylase [Opitutia bacterium]